MSIIRVEARPRWTSISNEVLNDDNLSFKALGLLVWLLSKPDNWEVYTAHIAKFRKEGIDAIRSILNELIEAGYIERNQIRGRDGRIEKLEYIVRESKTVESTASSPERENPVLENPVLEKPVLASIIKEKTDLNKKTTTKTESSSSSFPIFNILPNILQTESIKKTIARHSQTLPEDELKAYVAYAISKADTSNPDRFRAFLDRSIQQKWIIPPAAEQKQTPAPAITIPGRARIKIGDTVYPAECGGFVKTESGTIPPGLLQNMIKQGKATVLS